MELKQFLQLNEKQKISFSDVIKRAKTNAKDSHING